MLPRAVHDELARLGSHFEIKESNDRGGNGYLFFGMNRVSNQQVAIKFYYGDPGDSQHDEPRQLAEIDNQNVLKILDAKIAGDGWAYFVTPRCAGGDLDDLVAESPSVHTALNVALGVCAGVACMHSLGMVHRDLKPGNVVLENGIPRIADFGSVRRLNPQDLEVTASRHSVLYRPPESFSSGKYTVQGDIYQIGVVTYQLLGGKLSYVPEDYLSAPERAQIKSLHAADQCAFVDKVIQRRAEKGKLLDFNSLPSWIDAATIRMLKKLSAPTASARAKGIADVSAGILSARNRLPDWKLEGCVPTLLVGRRELKIVEELRLYQIYSANGNSRRRLGSAHGSMKDAVLKCNAYLERNPN